MGESSAKQHERERDQHAECCAVMDMALNRANERLGLSREQAWNFQTGKHTRDVTVYRMRRGKKGEPHDRFRDSTFAIVTHCPFCGAKVKP